MLTVKLLRDLCVSHITACPDNLFLFPLKIRQPFVESMGSLWFRKTLTRRSNYWSYQKWKRKLGLYNLDGFARYFFFFFYSYTFTINGSWFLSIFLLLSNVRSNKSKENSSITYFVILFLNPSFHKLHNKFLHEKPQASFTHTFTPHRNIT